MSAERKHVVLTETEREGLKYHIGGWKFTLRQSPADAEEAFMRDVAVIIAAREAAAEQAGREDNALHDMCYVSGPKALEAREAAARREALLEARDYLSEQEQFNAAELVRALLAEPERDEEGGR